MERVWSSSRLTATRRIGEASDGVEGSCKRTICERINKTKDVYRGPGGLKR